MAHYRHLFIFKSQTGAFDVRVLALERHERRRPVYRQVDSFPAFYSLPFPSMEQQNIPSAEEASAAAQTLATETWNPLTNWRKPAAARTLGKRRAVMAKRATTSSKARRTSTSKRSPARASRARTKTPSTSRKTSRGKKSPARASRASATSRTKTMRSRSASKGRKRASRR
jgi:hypothetical protein